MIRRFATNTPERSGRPATLRRRLLISYGGLALLTVVLASGASLAIFELQGERRSRLDMAHNTARFASALEASAEDRPDRTLRSLIQRSRRFARSLGDVLIVDHEGRVIEASGRFAAELASLTMPPRPSESELPTVRRVRFDGLPTLYSASLPLPTISEQLGIQDGVSLVLLRPAAEFQGAWRSLAPAIALVGTLALILTGAMAVVLARSITRPLEALTQASERLAEGDHSVRVTGEGSDEIAQLARSFNSMAREVGDAHVRQQDFVANVGHDLRTPLTSIIGFTGALQDGTARTEADRSAALTRIAGAAKRMGGLVEQLLELARLEQHAERLDLARCDARTLLEGAAEAVADHASARRVNVEISAPSGLSVRADARWLGRALANVVENAVRHSEEGGTVVLGARVADTTETRSQDARCIAIEVADTGAGITQDDLPRVFERFYRGDPSRTNGASGLGLSITREIVEAHGGTIDITSQEGTGTTVTLIVPAGGEEAS